MLEAVFRQLVDEGYQIVAGCDVPAGTSVLRRDEFLAVARRAAIETFPFVLIRDMGDWTGYSAQWDEENDVEMPERLVHSDIMPPFLPCLAQRMGHETADVLRADYQFLKLETEPTELTDLLLSRGALIWLTDWRDADRDAGADS